MLSFEVMPSQIASWCSLLVIAKDPSVDRARLPPLYEGHLHVSQITGLVSRQRACRSRTSLSVSTCKIFSLVSIHGPKRVCWQTRCKICKIWVACWRCARTGCRPNLGWRKSRMKRAWHLRSAPHRKLRLAYLSKIAFSFWFGFKP